MKTLAADHPQASAASPQCNTRGLRFLVVEDHPLQRQMLAGALRTIGAEMIDEAEEGREALQILRGAKPSVDIVICDLDMPNMDGMAFIRHLGDGAEQPALIVTSALDPGLLSSVETMARAYGIRLLGTIEKPATPDKLASLIMERDSGMRGGTRASVCTLNESEVVAALEDDRIVAFFQPKVSLSTGALVGAEALARLKHPDLGMRLPASFMGLIEQLGLIDRLTWSMLRQSAMACSAWQQQGIDITVSVNLSQASLSDPSLAGRITSLVSRQHLDPRKMVLEITESAAMTEVGPALENLTRLRMKGFGLSIDDFGTGYSSMQQLSRIPFTELKIDRSFVSGAPEHAQRKIILESSNDLARRLGLKSVAEGVETRGEWEELQRVGCLIAQGYFIAQPMPAADFLHWAKNWQPQSLLR